MNWPLIAILSGEDDIATQQVRDWFADHCGELPDDAYHALANIIGDPDVKRAWAARRDPATKPDDLCAPHRVRRTDCLKCEQEISHEKEVMHLSSPQAQEPGRSPEKAGSTPVSDAPIHEKPTPGFLAKQIASSQQRIAKWPADVREATRIDAEQLGEGSIPDETKGTPDHM